MKGEELSITLKRCRQPGNRVITVEYENGCKQVIRPSAAYAGGDHLVAASVAGNQPFKVLNED
jgi:hypothetical protein